MKKLRMIFLLILCALIGAAAFYFLYYQKTPAYSLFLAHQAARRHDLAAFEERVDLDSVLDYAYDDIVKGIGRSFTVEEQQLTGSVLGLFKKVFVLGMKEVVREEIKQPRPGGEARPETGKKAFDLPIRRPFIIKDILEQIKPGKIDFRGTGRSTTEGGSATVEVLLFDRELNKDIAITARLYRQDGLWRLDRLENIGDYLMELLAARKGRAAGQKKAS